MRRHSAVDGRLQCGLVKGIQSGRRGRPSFCLLFMASLPPLLGQVRLTTVSPCFLLFNFLFFPSFSLPF